ncbi:MAG: alanine/ornithine racemase family PLP-dependent enzyme [Anaerovoracaceae bacterium]
MESNENRYPQVEVNLRYLRDNVRTALEKCGELGIEVTGVVKGMSSMPEAAKAFVDAGCRTLGSSRIDQIIRMREAGIDVPMMMIRVPMMSEAADIVKYTEYSLESDISVMRAIDREAVRQGRKHSVILMVEMGDLREGFYDMNELCDAAREVEGMKGLYLAGVGMNVGCYGSILPTYEKLEEFVAVAEKVEAAIGRKLDIISGGATSTLMRVMDGKVPARINHLRVGEGILNARDLGEFYGYDEKDMHKDVFTIKAEVVEVKDKPTYPQGEIGRDAFGHVIEYEDRGIRRRALVALGKIDYGSIDDIFPKDSDIKVIGASSDHTILDVEDSDRDLKAGDIVEFGLDYGAMVYVTSSPNVRHVFVE